MRLCKIIFFVVIFQLIIVQSLYAATLQGRVRCEDEKPYPEPVDIEIIDQESPISTDKKSHYSLALPPGEYIFKIMGEYFKVVVYTQNEPRDFYLPCK